MDECVGVAIRIKPTVHPVETCLEIINDDPAVLLFLDKSQTFHFDNIFTAQKEQLDVYEDSVKNLVEKVKLGYNCTAFAYGQTGTGKSYTMGTDAYDYFDDDHKGIIPRTLEDFFNEENGEDFRLSISYIEIYNEKVYDLLNNSQNKCPLVVKGFNVQGFTLERIYNVGEALLYLKNGNKNRHTGETKQNQNSSRSHAIFTIYCHTKNDHQDTVAKLNLVDLAGSESVRKTGTQGTSFQEGISINKGLLSLGQVMAALSNKSTHIPYRQSIVTTILQDSLNKNNFILLIGCVSSNADDSGETLQTLEFASRVKRMKNKPEVNHFLTQYKKHNPNLFLNVRGLTPSKRPASISNNFETPFKRKQSCMPMIAEANHSDVSASKSLFSISSTSTAISSGQQQEQNFSPVIKKYMTAMENSIMHKLEGVIENTLRKQKRRSSRLAEKENKTPLPRSNIINIVRSEILKMTGKTMQSSSPLEGTSPIEPHFELPRMRLIYDESNNSLQLDDEKNKSDDGVFKMTAPKEEKTQKPSRRSIRLQIKEINKENDSFQATPLKQTPTKRCTNCRTPAIKRLQAIENISNDSPITARTKHVLRILNEGQLKDIVKLHTIGPKTAEKILLLRQMKNGFQSISDLSKMPYWTKNKYEKFMLENFLTRDE